MRSGRAFFSFFILTLLILSFSACSLKNPPPTMIDQGQIQVINHGTTQMATYIIKGEDGVWLCKENVTDAVKMSREGVNFNQLSLNESVGVGESTGALSLGGMAPEVLITSELLYRACELCANLNADKQLTLEIYKMFIDSVDKTAAAQIESGSKAVYGNAASVLEDSSTSSNNSDSDDDLDDESDDDDDSDDS